MVAFAARRIMQVIRCTDAVRAANTWDPGELVYATDTGELWIGDGSTAGGVAPKTRAERWVALTTTGGVSIGTAPGTTLALDVEIRRDADAFTRASGVVTCLRAGWLEIAADLSVSMATASTTGKVRLAVQHNPGTGTFANIPGGFGFTPAINSGGTVIEATASVRTLLLVAANDQVRCQAVRGAGAVTINTVADGCRLTMRHIGAP